MNESLWAAAFFASCSASLLLTPLIRNIARRIGFVDHPDAHRKIHRSATAMGGGLAIVASVLLTCLLVALLPGTAARISSSGHALQLLGIVPGVLLICLIGLWDDARRIRARYKFAAQIVAASIVAYSGLTFEQVSLAGFTFELGWLAVPVTVFWLVACINALNLIDGADGLASVVGIVLSGTIACTAITLHNELAAIIALALTGALLGFLRYNAPPATIFLGDAGSMSVGLLAGCLTIQGNTKGAAAYALFAPLAMWIIPMMDVGMAIVRRKLTGRSLSATDRNHLHHCLLAQGLSERQLLAFVGGLCAFCGLGAWMTVRFSNSWFAVLSSLAVVGFLVSRRIFGHVEFQLAGHHLAGLGRRIMQRNAEVGQVPWQSQVRLQGVRPWEELWAFLVDAAEDLQICRLTLNLSLPWLHEGYHANWIRPTPLNSDKIVKLTWPLMSGERHIGTLSIASDIDVNQVRWFEKLGELLAEIQNRIPELEPSISIEQELVASRVAGDGTTVQSVREGSMPGF